MLNVATCQDPEYPLHEVTHDAAEYYLREGEAPGRWWGTGATTLGLAGEVECTALRDLFAGKDPHTGAYLISARGSSARATSRHSEADLDVSAAAARLGMTVEAVRTRLRAGRLAGSKASDGRWRIPTAAVDAYARGAEQPRCLGPMPAPAADGTYALAEAARVAGVHRSYLARLVSENPPRVTTRADGRPLQFLVGHRDDDGSWRVRTVDLQRFMAARTAPGAVPAYDLAMRAPKSVSILHALGHLVPPERLAGLGLPTNLAAEVLAAHHASVADALDLIQRHAAWVRAPGGPVQASGLTVALFDHRSSRTGDPLLHSHAVIANLASGVDGRRAALDGTALYAWASTAGHVYQARLRAELVARLGVRFHDPHNGLADLVGVPRELIEEFSERRRQVLEVMGMLGTSGAKAAQAATLATRPAKDDASHQTPSQLASRAVARAFGPDQIVALVGQGPELSPSPDQLGKLAARLASPEGLTARATRVDLRDAIRGFATEMPSGASTRQLERWATVLLHDGHRFVPVLGRPSRRADVIRRSDGRPVRAGGVGQTYSTPELLAHEARLIAGHADGLGPEGAGVGLGVAELGAVARAIASRPSLSGEQVAMVRRITTSGIGVDVVVGGPGTGKTFALGAAAEAWRSSGLRVVGAALQGGAAEVLAREARLDEQHTLTGLLMRCDRVGSAYLEGSVVLVDEAGMGDTRQLSRLVRYAATARAKLVLVGDPDQIPEVGAGGAFGHLVQKLGDGVVALRHNRRQRSPTDRQRLGLIRRGHAIAAIESARAEGRWHHAPSGDALRQQLLIDWYDDPAAPATEKLMIATTIAEVEWLNQAPRALLLADTRLGDVALSIHLSAPDRAADIRELRVGDVVRATRNDWTIGVFTGSIGTVVGLDPDRFEARVDLEEGRGPTRSVTLARRFLEERTMTNLDGEQRTEAPGLTHAYASTAHAVQGRTAEHAYVLVARAGLHRQAAYVAASRAASRTQFYGLTVPDPDELDRADRGRAAPSPDPEDVAALAEAMALDASQTMASAHDPMAAAAGELMCRPTSWLWREYTELASQLDARMPLAESLRQVRTAIADGYGLDLEPLECRQLSAALTRALDVPGATPERVSELVLHRDRDAVRELASAADPMAVLVWSAGTHAVEVLQHAAPAVDAERARLRLLDVAIARQRQGRLALATTDVNGPIPAMIGPPPRTTGGLAAWRRAAAAILDYRDSVGLFDRDTEHSDTLCRVLGERPDSSVRLAHYEQVLDIAGEAQIAMTLAHLATLVPAAPARPPQDVEQLAGRSLRSLGKEITLLRRASQDRVRWTTRAAAASRVLAEAEAAALHTGGPSTNSGQTIARPITHPGRPLHHPDAQLPNQRLVQAREAAEHAQAQLDLLRPPTPGRLGVLERATTIREGRRRATVLREPPPWVRSDLAARVRPGHGSLRTTEVERLASAYGDIAVFADSWDLSSDAGTIDAILGEDPAPAAQAAWVAVRDTLHLGAIAHGARVELGL